jgi:hypothetical protein
VDIVWPVSAQVRFPAWETLSLVDHLAVKNWSLDQIDAGRADCARQLLLCTPILSR